MAKTLVDRYGRQMDTLRISLTDQCNLRCLYCMPDEESNLSLRSEPLSFEEIVKLTRIFIVLGVNKIKLTGGEPLIRKGMVDLIGTLSSLPGLKDLSLTTNGLFLSFYAERLKKAGLKRINISLDTLQREKFKFITGYDRMHEVLAGIKSALDTGFMPVKINAVLLKGMNDDEIIDFVNLIHSQNLVVRFIEFMPTCNNLRNWSKFFVSCDEVLKKICKMGEMVTEEKGIVGSGPAEYFKIAGYQGRLGIINPVSKPFCHSCCRLRVTSDGKLVLCLHQPTSFDLRPLLKEGKEAELVSLIKYAVWEKPTGYPTAISASDDKSTIMCQVGG